MPATSESDWYLREWVTALGRRQADLTEVIGQKTTAHRLWHSRQPYRRSEVNAIASWLGIEAYELLMPPEKAMALRRYEEAARQIVGEPIFAEAAERGRRYEGPAKR